MSDERVSVGRIPKLKMLDFQQHFDKSFWKEIKKNFFRIQKLWRICLQVKLESVFHKTKKNFLHKSQDWEYYETLNLMSKGWSSRFLKFVCNTTWKWRISLTTEVRYPMGILNKMFSFYIIVFYLKKAIMQV